MPKGHPNPKPSSPPAAQPDSAAPMIIIQPRADGTRLDAYNLAVAEIVEELRRSIIHLVATGAGVTVISHDIPRAAAALVRNGASPKSAPARQLVRKAARPASFDEDDDSDLTI